MKVMALIVCLVLCLDSAQACKKKPKAEAPEAPAAGAKNEGNGRGGYSGCVSSACPNNTSACQAQCAYGDNGPRWDMPAEAQGGASYGMNQ